MKTNLLSAFYFCSIAIYLVAGEEIETEDGILVLTQDNFKQAITDNEFILVEFYAPWCGYCNAFAPEYVEAAKTLAEQGSKAKLAKVDGTAEIKLAQEHKVSGFPTLKFYRNGDYIDYTGGRKAPDVVSWLNKKTGPIAQSLTTVEEAKEFTEASEVAIIGFFKDESSEKAKAFLAAAASMDNYPFAITAEAALIKHYETNDENIILFQKFDEGKVVFEGEATKADIKKFIVKNSLPLIVEYSDKTSQKLFSGEVKNFLFLFLNKADEHFEKVSQAARAVALSFKDQVVFVTIDSSVEGHQKIYDFLGVKKVEVPTARLIKRDGEMLKFKPETNDLSPESIKKFVEDFLAGKLKRHYLSQDLPDDWDEEPVKVLVASNFDKVALDSEKDVLVEFYAPWCGHCKKLAPDYDKVGEHFKESKDVVIAKIDATANEFENIKITSIPTIYFYPKGDNTPIEYKGPRTFEGITKFVEAGGVEEAEVKTENDDTQKKDEL